MSCDSSFLLGHRERKRNQVRNLSVSDIEELDILEIMLFYCIPRKDVRDIAKFILQEFKTIHNFLSSEEILWRELILKKYTLNENTIFFFKILKSLIYRVTLQNVVHSPVLKNWTKVLEFLKVNISFSTTEKLVVLFLDSAHRLKNVYYQSLGCVNETPVSIKTILKKGIALDSTKIIISHNHPSGNIQPSEQDIQVTKKLEASCQVLDIKLIDHIIVSKNDHYSFAENGLINIL
ncbi:RadC family protein [Anaplasmataceae bacterium AB001_6]|nr:RadC family protein [Anaplasmataceae bacterium AB001_6]